MTHIKPPSMKKLLIIDDSKEISDSVAEYFRAKEYIVKCVYTGEDGLAEVKKTNYDIILLDIVLPDFDGFSLCEILRKDGVETPVIMLTRKNSTDDVVRGLDMGADGYMTKPFRVKELEARIKALLKRTPQSVKELIRIGDLTIDSKRHEVFWKERLLNLRNKEFQILLLLAREQGRILNREDILNKTWDYSSDPYPGTIDVHISNLRKALENAGIDKNMIETVHNSGYRVNHEYITQNTQ